MQRETLLAILGNVPGLRKDGTRYLIQDGLEIAVYVGQPGRAAALEHVLAVGVPESHIEVEVRDRGTFYLPYDAVNGVLATPRKERKSASGGVGF